MSIKPAPDAKSPTVHALLADRGAPASGRLPDALARLRNATAKEGGGFKDAAKRHARLGVALLNAGQPDKAVNELKRSVDFDWENAAAHHDLGVALLALGNLETAVGAFDEAVRLDPSLASAHHNRAYVLDSLGREAAAMISYEAAVRLKPDLVVAQSRLGDMYLARGRAEDAAKAYEAVAAAKPGGLEAKIARARALDARGQRQAAIEAMRAVIDTAPDHAEAHLFLGRFLAQAGQAADAATHFERAITLSPALAPVWGAVATNRKFTADDAPLIARMDDSLANPKLTPVHRQAIHFALGKALDDIGDYETAMRHVDLANQIRSRSSKLDRGGLARRMDQMIELYGPGISDHEQDVGSLDATPILIVGMPRSGTTLTEQILSSHPSVVAGGELAFWGDTDLGRGQLKAGVRPDRAEAADIAARYLRVLRSFSAEAAHVTDKAPFNFALLGMVHQIFPNARLVHCRRNPIDTCLSIFSTNFEMPFDFVPDRGDLVFFYRQYERLMDHWRQVLPNDRFVEANYEALVADPEGQTRSLIQACGLEWNDACLAPQNNQRRIATASMWQARQPIYRTSAERWRRYEPWLGELRDLARDA